jgi:hypothetical protein
MAKSTIAGASNYRDNLEPWKGEGPSRGISSLTSESRPGRSGSSGTPDLPSPVPAAESLSEKDLSPSPAPSSSASSTDGSTPETGSSPVHPPVSSEASAAPTPATPDPAPEPEAELSDYPCRTCGLPEVHHLEGKVSSGHPYLTAKPAAAEDPVLPAPEEPRAAAEISAELISAAHAAYEDKDFDLAEELLLEAEKIDPNVRDATAGPHEAIASARLAAKEAGSSS